MGSTVGRASRRSPRGRAGGAPAAVVYCRVSTKEQVKSLSLSTQQRACEGFCRERGLRVLKVFVEEGESAKTADRPRLIELMEYCRENQGAVQHVVVYKIDRFARQTLDHAVLAGNLKRYGVTIRSATEPITDDPTGALTENMLAAFAQFDNDMRAVRTKHGMQAVIREGRWPWRAPIGYQHVRRGDGKASIEADPRNAPLVRRAFEQFASGRFAKADVLREVSALGLRTPKGAPLTPQSFQRLLENPLYAGRIVVPDWGITGARASFDPIVSEDVFDDVQAVLGGRQTTLTKYLRSHPDFPLRRFVRCESCGTPLTASHSTGRSARYAYYRCPQKGCRAVNEPKQEFENTFLDYLCGLCPRPEYVALFREIVRDTWRTKRSDAAEAKLAQERRLADLEAQRARLLRTYYGRGTIDDDIYRREDDRLRDEIAVTRSILHDAELDEVDIEAVLNFAEHLILDARRMWTEATLDQRQRLQQLLFPRGVTYSHQNGFGTAEHCLFFRWLAALPSEKEQMASPAGFEPASPT